MKKTGGVEEGGDGEEEEETVGVKSTLVSQEVLFFARAKHFCFMGSVKWCRTTTPN